MRYQPCDVGMPLMEAWNAAWSAPKRSAEYKERGSRLRMWMKHKQGCKQCLGLASGEASEGVEKEGEHGEDRVDCGDFGGATADGGDVGAGLGG